MTRDGKLRLHRRTVRHLSHRELGSVRGAADDIEPVTRAFTGCEYCGNTNAAPNPCKESYQGCPDPEPSGNLGCEIGTTIGGTATTISDTITRFVC